MATPEFPGVTGLFSPDRFPLYGVIQDGKNFRVTVEVRERTAGATRVAVPQVALPEIYKRQRGAAGADVVMERLNMRVYHEVMEAYLTAKYEEVSRG